MSTLLLLPPTRPTRGRAFRDKLNSGLSPLVLSTQKSNQIVLIGLKTKFYKRLHSGVNLTTFLNDAPGDTVKTFLFLKVLFFAA